MEDLVYISLVLIILCLLLFGLGSAIVRWLYKSVLFIVSLPYQLWKWKRSSQVANTRKKNYEVLGKYVALLDNNSDLLKYFRRLIEKGISEREFQELLQTNLHNLRDVNYEVQKQEQDQKLTHEQTMQQMAAQQQELLVQSQLSLEQIKFREQLLEQLYHKIRKKYHL